MSSLSIGGTVPDVKNVAYEAAYVAHPASRSVS